MRLLEPRSIHPAPERQLEALFPRVASSVADEHILRVYLCSGIRPGRAVSKCIELLTLKGLEYADTSRCFPRENPYRHCRPPSHSQPRKPIVLPQR